MLEHHITGKGLPVVFIHGFCESKEVWNTCHELLSDTNTIIGINLPGTGKSPLLPNLTIEEMAIAAQKTIKDLGYTQALVVGHSMGGYVALAMAELFPNLVLGLCLFHSTAFADSDEKKMQRNKTIAYLHEHGVESFIRPFVPPLFYPQNRKRCDRAIQLLVEMGCGIAIETISSCAAAMRDRIDRTHVLVNARYPVLFILGKNDAAVKYEDSLKQIDLAPETYVQILADTAHQGIFERQAETIKMLAAFFKIVERPKVR